MARLAAMSDDLRGCVILAADGSALAASGELDRWAEAARGLLAAADAAAGEPVTHAHVGTEDGEAFAVRHQGFALVAAVERFALAGLMLFDIRAVLRDLARGVDAPAAAPAPPRPPDGAEAPPAAARPGFRLRRRGVGVPAPPPAHPAPVRPRPCARRQGRARARPRPRPGASSSSPPRG